MPHACKASVFPRKNTRAQGQDVNASLKNDRGRSDMRAGTQLIIRKTGISF